MSPSSSEVDGLETIEEFGETNGYVIPEGPYDTVAGFFMALLGALPKLGDSLTFTLPAENPHDDTPGRFTLEATQMDGRRAAWFSLRRESVPVVDTDA